MRGTRKATLVIFLLVSMLLVGLSANADVTPVSFNIDTETVTDKILEDGVAEFSLTINNLQDVEDTFRVLPLEDVKWTPQFVPTTDRVVTITGDGSRTIKMLVKPNEVIMSKYLLNLETLRPDIMLS